MKITVTAMTLCDLLGGKFTLEACEAMEEYFEECGDPATAPHLGDLMVGFAEMAEKDMDEDDEERAIAHLNNGNVLVMW